LSRLTDTALLLVKELERRLQDSLHLDLAHRDLDIRAILDLDVLTLEQRVDLDILELGRGLPTG
jgi:hypothetical protein